MMLPSCVQKVEIHLASSVARQMH